MKAVTRSIAVVALTLSLFGFAPAAATRAEACDSCHKRPRCCWHSHSHCHTYYYCYYDCCTHTWYRCHSHYWHCHSHCR